MVRLLLHFCYAIKVSFFIHFYRKDLSLHKNPIDIDIGVAMGVTGTEVAKDAAAMVLTDDNFATIVKAVENGRNLYQNIKNTIQFLLSGNFGAILAVLCAPIAGDTSSFTTGSDIVVDGAFTCF